MTAIKHLLVATDGSESAFKAAAFAGDLARGLGARVTVLMVQSEEAVLPHAWGVGEYPVAVPYASMTVEEVRTMLEERARENELARTGEAIGKLAAPPDLVYRWGHAAEEICRYAVDNDVDLMVIGSHGRSAFKRALLGSISNAVANHATCPVTIVR
ncbi:MAG: universal stress protein [Gammaproteobacteria bacterium]